MEKRILIVRLSAIGDTIHSLPLAAALRDAFPKAYIGWVVEKPSATLIENNPLLDWVKVLPKGWLKSPSLTMTLRRELRQQNFTIAFDIQGLTKSATAAWLSGAKARIGFARGEGRELAPLLDNLLVRPRGKHAVDMTLSLLDGLGLPAPESPRFVIPSPSAKDAELIDETLSAERFGRGFVLLGPWGSFPSKLWPLDRFLELAKRIQADAGLPSLMLGYGDLERGQVEELAARSGGSLEAAPGVAVTGVAELARRARLFVGCDSFPMHAAAAVGCPTVGLFGITDPQRLGPYGKHGRAVFEKITLVKSTRERRRLTPENLQALSVEKVWDACREMLE